MSTLGTDSFTGADGSAWASPWTTGRDATGVPGSVTIQNNVGRITTGGDTSPSFSFANRVSRRYGETAVSDVVMRARWRYPGTDSYTHFWVRAHGSLVGDTGYYLALSPPDNNWIIWRVQGFGVPTMVGTVQSMAFQPNAWYNVTFGVVGSSIKGKVWKDGDSEPGWIVEATDASPLPQRFYGVEVRPGATGGNYAEIDDFAAYTTFAEAYPPPNPVVSPTTTFGSAIQGRRTDRSSVSGATTSSSSISGRRTDSKPLTGASSFSASVSGAVSKDLVGSSLFEAYIDPMVDTMNIGDVNGESVFGLMAITSTDPKGPLEGSTTFGAELQAGVGAFFRTPAYKQHPRDRHPLIARTYIPVGVTLLKFNGSYRTYIDTDPELITAADRVYLGGHIYFLDFNEVDSLRQAGYGQWVSAGYPSSANDDFQAIDYSQYGGGIYGTGPYGA